MKTFLLNIPNQIRNWSNTLDAKTVLSSQAWNVFNDEGVKEVYIFKNDGTLIASHDGKAAKAKWEYLAQNSSIIIENLDADAYMLKPTYFDDKVLALQVDGTNNYAVMISQKFENQLVFDSVQTACLYITDRKAYNQKKEEERQIRLKIEKDRLERYNAFIEQKAQEYMEQPEYKRKKRNQIIIRSFISLISVVITGLLISLEKCSDEDFATPVLILLGTLIVILLIIWSSFSTKIDVIIEFKKKYPLENFQQ